MRNWYFGPPRSWRWTRRTVVAAAVFFCALYVEGYRTSWSAAERLYLWEYVESGAWGGISANSYTNYKLLEGVTAKGVALWVRNEEIEPFTNADGEPGYRLTGEGTRDGYVRLEWRSGEYNDRKLHRLLGKWVFQDDLRETAKWPLRWTLALLALLLPVAVPSDRWPKFSYAEQWLKLRSFLERRRERRRAAAAPAKQAKQAAPVAVAAVKAPSVAAVKPAEEKRVEVQKPRPRFE
jgi:hypothetical protein